MLRVFLRPCLSAIVAFVAIALLHIAPAFGQVPQRSQFEVQLSTDGVTWHSQLAVFTMQPARVYGRVLVTWVGNGTPDPLWFNNCRFQPTGAGWNVAAGDAVIPFNATGRVTANYTPGAEVLGRVFGATTTSAVIAHQYSFGGQNYLRFAEGAAANHPGQGTGSNNVTGGAGINCSNNTLSPQFGIIQRPLFTWGMVFSTGRSGSMEWSIPQEAFRTSGATANPPNTRSATWLTSSSPFTAVEAPTLPTLGATIVLLPCDASPVVQTQPQSQAVCPGAPVSLSVVAASAQSYQWRKGGTIIPGATNATLSIAAATGSDTGQYDCVVANQCGSVTTNAATLALREPPSIIVQPNSTSVCQGQLGAFYVAARGSSLTYQWRRNGVDIAGAQSATLVIASVTSADNGAYDCVISNACGSLTTSPADLLVNAPPSIAVPPVSTTTCAGDVTVFSVGIQGSGLAIQWRKDGVNIPGATGPSFAIGSSSEADAGSYDCVVSNSCGSVSSSAATLTVSDTPTVTLEPTSATVCVGESATFSVGASGADAQFQWRRDGSDIPGATSPTLTLAAVTASDAGSFACVISNACGTVTTTSASLMVNAPITVTVQPVSASTCDGQSASFTVAVTGSSPSFQWRRGGSNIPGATNATLTIAAANASDVESYDCVVSNPCGAVTTSSASLTVSVPVSITSQPLTSTVCSGQTASFSVVASGTAPQFQWRKGGTNIPNATSATLTIAEASEADEGSYFCVVSNSCGSVATTSAALTVDAPLALTEQPAGLSRCEGQSATFSVAATGTSPAYQWRRNGVDIAGATSPTLAFSSVGLPDAGSYDCVVSSACGTLTSSAATLTVNAAPVITVQPASITPDIGQPTATFSVAATGGGTYQWRRNGVAISDGGRISGTTEATLTISSVSWNDPGSYSCVLTNACGSATTSEATLDIFTCTEVAAHFASQPISTRTSMGQAYSGVNGGTLVFGGTTDGTTALGDTWLLTNGVWNRVATTGPGIRAITSMCELGNGRVLLFGGQAVVQDVASAYGDTWEWNGTTWTRLATSGPTPRSDHTMVYDSIRNRVVLFGGLSITGQFMNDTWEWNGTFWTQMPAAGPGARFGHAAAFDPVSGETIVYGGWDGWVDGETWAWNGSTWRLAATTGIVARSYSGMTFDANVGKVLLFGGFEGGANVMNDSYYWTGSAWQPTGLAPIAPNRWLHGMTFDYTSRSVVINAGRGLNQVRLNDTTIFSSRPIPISHPQNQTLVPGGSATFGVTSSRPDTIFQWRKDGANLTNDARIAGATSPTLMINNLQASDAGSYTCVLLNACGSNFSRAATLGCVPTVAQSPTGGDVRSGRRLVLTGQIVSTGATTYRWKKDGANLFNGTLYSGVTTQTLTIYAEDPSQSGVYTLTGTNSCGTSTTNGAVVTVTCLADVTGDGNVDGDDVIEFFAVWDEGAASADLNEDGSTDGDDVIALFDRWDRGC